MRRCRLLAYCWLTILLAGCGLFQENSNAPSTSETKESEQKQLSSKAECEPFQGKPMERTWKTPKIIAEKYCPESEDSDDKQCVDYNSLCTHNAAHPCTLDERLSGTCGVWRNVGENPKPKLCCPCPLC